MSIGHFDGVNHVSKLETISWIRAIRTNDSTTVAEILENAGEDRKALLDGRLEVGSVPAVHEKYSNLRFGHSLVMAIACKAHDVIETMLSYGADVTVRERHGNNILHVLTLLCDARCELVPEIVELYRWLTGKLDVDITRELLHSENDEGMRPLELASQKGFFQLVMAIYQTKDVYLVEEEDEGILTYQHFDITEYEGPKALRLEKSPLAFFTYMDWKCVDRAGTAELSSWQPLKQWYNYKAKSNYPLAVLWGTYRIGMIISYYTLMITFGKSTSSEPDSLCASVSEMVLARETASKFFVFTFICSLAIVIFDLVAMVLRVAKKRPYVVYKNAYGGQTVVSVLLYRVVQGALAWLFLIGSIMYFSMGLPTPRVAPLVEAMNICVVAGTSYCLLYFLQLVPVLGHYVVIVNRMMTDLLFFLILYIICLLPFSFYFLVFFNTHSGQGCVDEFSTYGESMYSCFLIMLNMIDLRNYELHHFQLIQFMHICFVFVIALLLINFLIAVMTNSTSILAENKVTIQRLQRLQIFITLEFRFHWLLSRYYGYMARRLGLLRNDRVLLTNVIWNTKFSDASDT